jgi:uncharacterized protein YprB with RNaseH-like and TPR domain/predicted nuclease with RNAse H fold/adenylate kinase family enzyme
MIRNTFLHLPGVGQLKERRLWDAGYRDWDSLWERLRSGVAIRDIFHDRKQRTFDFDEASTDPVESVDDQVATGVKWLDCIDQSKRAFIARDYAFFLSSLRPSDHWRLLPNSIDDALFLDIETTGLSRNHHYITVIGAMYHGAFYQWTWSQSLDQLAELIAEAPLVITFNGSRFDLPFVRDQLPQLPSPRAHIDLLYSSRAAGFEGGQKDLEIKLGLGRASELVGFDGLEAVAAWCGGLYGDAEQYTRLLKYNRADVEMLPRIAKALTTKLVSDLASFPIPTMPESSPRTRRAHAPLMFSALRKVWHARRPELSRLENRLQLSFGRMPTVVGIDLRAKAERPTGWAVCRGASTQTAVLDTDEAIIQRTLDAKPDLISIDAPLGLPRGRVSVSDDSPCRKLGGIVRDAERVLWSRGIRVYPALIRQMQGLTARGIQLTKRFQEYGIEVIESYPGAAQDVLNIPRKQQGESLLDRGLRQFGYSYDGPQTHDELDAITSALVGHFYLAGEFEAIGASDEGFMIIPRSHSMAWNKLPPRRLVISVVGLPGAGKTTLTLALAERFGWDYFALGEALRELSRTDDHLRELLANGQLAPEPVVRELLETVLSSRAGNLPILLDGFPRHTDQIGLLDELGLNWKAIFLDLPEEIASKRVLSRQLCKECGHIGTTAADVACPNCGVRNWAIREDDNAPAVSFRFGVTRDQFSRLIRSLQNDRLIRINSDQDSQSVVDEAAASVERVISGC